MLLFHRSHFRITVRCLCRNGVVMLIRIAEEWVPGVALFNYQRLGSAGSRVPLVTQLALETAVALPPFTQIWKKETLSPLLEDSVTFGARVDRVPRVTLRTIFSRDIEQGGQHASTPRGFGDCFFQQARFQGEGELHAPLFVRRRRGKHKSTKKRKKEARALPRRRR